MSGLSKNVKIIIAAAVSVLILVAGIATGILISSHRGDKDSYKASEESDSRNEQVISSNGTQKDKEQDKKWTDAAAEFKAVNSWESEGKKFTQYELTVTNHGSSAWKINFPVGSTTQLSQSWNCDISVDNNNGNVRFILVPADYNKKLEAGAKTQGIGFIVSMTDDYKLGDYDIETVVTDDTTKKLGIIRTDAFGKAEGDVNVKLYAFYDGANEEVKTTQLTALQENVGATVSFSATPTEFK